MKEFFVFVFFFPVFSALDVFSRRVITSVKAFAVPANTKAREKKKDAFSFFFVAAKKRTSPLRIIQKKTKCSQLQEAWDTSWI
jgi:hypothetical protein